MGSFQLHPKVQKFKGKKIAVVGLGKTGMSVARFCASMEADVTVLDEKPLSRLQEAVKFLKDLPIQFEVGSIRKEKLLEASLIILSPGVPPFLPALVQAKEAGIPITGELEFASQFIDAPIVGITGTNGKSTVTSLCGAIAAETGRPFFCGGNLGPPLIDSVKTEAAGKEGLVICEISSFQLETADTLHCHAAAILNITPDHLDRYPSLEAYGNEKAKIARNQAANDILVLNADDPEVLHAIKRNHGNKQALYFSLQPGARHSMVLGSPVQGFIEQDRLVLRWTSSLSASAGKEWEESYPMSELSLVGQHNLANALSAFLLMRGSGLATYDQVREATKKFRSLPHRMEKVAVISGITYYDDSKGTNVDAVAKSLSGFPTPFALIAGGRDKGGSYKPLSETLKANQVRGVVLIGEAAPLIEQALPKEIKTLRASSMEEAVSMATNLCQQGDSVVLSPACSSYDMYRDYAHRAQVFCDAVFAQKKEASTTE